MNMGSHLIQSSWREGRGPAFWSENPATNERLGEYRAGTADEVGDAVAAARAAFSAWSRLPVARRIEHVNAFAELLKRERASTAENSLPLLISRETGKPYWESLGELDAMANKVPLSIRAMRE